MLSFLKKIFLVFVAMKLFAAGDFFDPTTTPADDGTPNLSEPEKDASEAQITTNGSGQYVYAAWKRKDADEEFRIQVARSLNNGVTFSNPVATPPGTTTPNLSVGGKSALFPQITTNGSGEYVYAVWARKDDDDDYRIQVARSFNYGAAFSNPTTTPAGAPNLSASGKSASNSKITTDSTGRYVYAMWKREDDEEDGKFRTQVAISSNYGVTFADPTETPADDGPPNLSVSEGSAFYPEITTDSTGKHVYAVWSRNDGVNWRVQIAISSNNGVTFSNPETTPPGTTPPNLSVGEKSAFYPQITTSNSGEYVYVIWYRIDDEGKNRVQVARSSNNGIDFSNPTETPAGTPNLSVSGKNANYWPQIVTDATGKHVYAVWGANYGDNYRIQVARSSDYGNKFYYPTTTPAGTPNLAIGVPGVVSSEITTDSTGKYVYVTWNIDDGTNRRVQLAMSSDYGVTFSNPTTTPSGTTSPNLSVSEKDAFFPKITAGDTGQYVYVTWYRKDDDENLRVQVAISITGLNPSFNKYLTKFLLQNDRVVELFWNEFLGAKSYRVYFKSLNNPIYEGVENRFFHHGTNIKDMKTYYITWIDVNNVESPPAEIVVQ